MAKLRVSYKPDDEWNGELTGVVELSDGFAGRGTAWFSRDNLKETFIPALRAFPLSVGAPPLIENGFSSKTRPGELDQCHLRILIKAYNRRGGILVHVDLATEVWRDPDSDMHQSATIRFLCEYAALSRFATHLEEVLDGNRIEAVLHSTMS